MRILSFLIILLFMSFMNQQTKSPHGADFRISCSTCHSSKGWFLDREIYSFDHNKTAMKLKGQHSGLDCRQCHKTLIFSEARSNCFDCHSDIHQGTTGGDCSRCHSSESWLVSNIIDIHNLSRFPLLGAHRTADCIQCHKSESLVRFDVAGINCIDCHRQDYLATTNPDHQKSGISQDCEGCHKVNSFGWTGTAFNHDIFPLQLGHSSLACSACHKPGSYAGLSSACYSCHQNDFTGTTNPNHVTSQFSQVCSFCHSLAPGWKPASFDHSKFPLVLGHSIPACADCHKGGNYTTAIAAINRIMIPRLIQIIIWQAFQPHVQHVILSISDGNRRPLITANFPLHSAILYQHAQIVTRASGIMHPPQPIVMPVTRLTM